jgi:hypothetical protein
MYCPRCGKSAYCVDPTTELQTCEGCNLVRPIMWWSSLEVDINTDIDFNQIAPPETRDEDTLPEEFRGGREAPWVD